MFTGIVEEMGTVVGIDRGSRCESITVAARLALSGVIPGDSLSVNGVCVTVTRRDERGFTADLMPETMRRTNLRRLRPADRVNLERALRLGDRVGGHLVTGHVDGVGRLAAKSGHGGAILLEIEAPRPLMKYMAPQGSVAVDGVSLTVVDASGSRFTVSEIPHTARLTTLGFKTMGDEVNLEVDLVARYLESLHLTGERGFADHVRGRG